MSFVSRDLLERLVRLEDVAGVPERYVVAVSGGLDSSVLLHALATTREAHGKRLCALHVDHGLHPESASWAAASRALAERLGVDHDTLVADVDKAAGAGPEAAAREARYRVLEAELVNGDWLLSAHHADDQAETLLLNLVRGSGPLGVAGIPEARKLGAGWLLRPLLAVRRRDLLDYASVAGLDWVEDPSNRDESLDRNFLRARVLPLLSERWPDAAGKLATSAGLSREAAGLLTALAAIDLDNCGGDPARIPLAGLVALDEARRNNLLRHAIRCIGLPSPGQVHLQEISRSLIAARDDASPCVSWPGAELRRHRDTLYLMSERPRATFADGARLDQAGVALGPGLGTLRLGAPASPGLSDAVLDRGLTVHRRKGGEEIRLLGHRHTRKIKKLLNEEGVLPWLRDAVPLVFAGDELVAVGDRWLADTAAADGGPGLVWDERPALH